MKLVKKSFAAWLIMAALCTPNFAAAQNQASDLADVVQFELLKGWRQKDGSHMVAVRVHLAKGWNTYWRVGGSLGIPPRFTFEGSENVQSAQIKWPRPSLFELHGSRVIGYLDELVLPVALTPIKAGQDIALQATLDLGVCSDICVPVQAHFTALLPTGDGSDDPSIRAALDQVPGPDVNGTPIHAECQLDPVKDGFHLVAEITTQKPAKGPEIGVVEFPNPDVWIGLPKVDRQGDRLILSVDMINYAGGAFNPDPAEIRLTVLHEDQALDIRGCTLTSG